MTKDEKLAVAACAILVACQDDNLRDLTAADRVTALAGRNKAAQILLATGFQPTELKDIGLDALREALNAGS